MKQIHIILLFALQALNCIRAQDIEKRGPQGFVGMRGKKYISSEELDHYYKRKPQFFVGVKGKKGVYDSIENFYSTYYKRAPLGFVGMRGKKEFYSDGKASTVDPQSGSMVGQIEYTSNGFEKFQKQENPVLSDLLFHYLMKTKPWLFDLQPELDNDVEDKGNSIEKRAASMHQFFGVRGKKSEASKRPFDLTFRGKFIGVRGKKSEQTGTNGGQEIKFLLGQNEPWPKRKGQMGFFGMRGKKSTEDQSLDDSTEPDTEMTN